MKSTGLTRRIDELGRIVIPKEIRRSLGIRDGENIEIMVEDNKIILTKHLIMENLIDISKKLIDIYSKIDKDSIIITDREKIISASDNLNYLEGQLFKSNLIKYIENREILELSYEKLEFSLNHIEGNFVIVPIISNTDSLGLVIFIKEGNFESYSVLKSAKILAKILAEKININ